MTLFFVLSGFLFSQKGSFKTTIASYFKKYVIPYVILCAINFFLCIAKDILSGDGISVTGIHRNLVGILLTKASTEWMPNCTPLWFGVCLFFAMSFYVLISKLEMYKRCIIICFCVVISTAFSVFDWPNLPRKTYDFYHGL